MEGGTGVYYQAMPAVGPDGKNVMKLIPVQKVDGHFFQTTFNAERNNVNHQWKAYANPAHSPSASSSQTLSQLSSIQPIAGTRYVLKALPRVRTFSDPVKNQQTATNKLIFHNPIQVHAPPVTQPIPQYAFQLPPQTSGQKMVAVQTLPVTVKSPVLPNGHFLQIPANAKVQTVPAASLPQSLKCRIMGSVSSTPNLDKSPPTVVLVSPVDSVKLNSNKQVVSIAKPAQMQKILSHNPQTTVQTVVSIHKNNKDVNTPIKWVVQERRGASGPCLVPLSTPNANTDSINTLKNINSASTANEIQPSKPTTPQTSQEKITPGKDNALVMCNGKVYLVAKKSSEIAKDVMVSESEKRGFISISPALPASSALGSSSTKQDPKIKASEIIDLCDDEEMPTCLGGTPGNLPIPSQTEVLDDSDEESNVIFVSYIPPNSEKSASQSRCEDAQPIELSDEADSQKEGERTAHAEMENDDFSDNTRVLDERMNVDEQLKENQLTEENASCLSENGNVEMEKNFQGESPLHTHQPFNEAVAETDNLMDQPQMDSCPASDNYNQVIGSPVPDQRSQPKSDSQLRKEFGITSDVQIHLERTKPILQPDQQTEQFVINKRNLEGLRKVIQESILQSQLHLMMQVPCITLEEGDGLKVKRKKQDHDGRDVFPLLSKSISPASVSTENSLVSQTSQKEVLLLTDSSDKHMQSEMAVDCTSKTYCATSPPKQGETLAASHSSPSTSTRKAPPRSKKGKVCTACPCGTILGVSETTSPLHQQEKLNPCTVVESHNGARKNVSNKAPMEKCQIQKSPPKQQGPVKKVKSKQTKSKSPCKDITSLENTTSETSRIPLLDSPVNATSLSANSSSSLPDCNNQLGFALNGASCNLSSNHTDAETFQQDTSPEQTASDNPIMPFSNTPPGPKIDMFPTQDLYSLEMLDAEEIKRRERIKRLKDLLKEKEAALERMQRNYNV